MQSKDLYARLELLSPEQVQKQTDAPATGRSRLANFQRQLGRRGAALLRYFAGSKEPRIAVKRDLYGDGSFYEVYDPVDGLYHIFATEQEVRVWLEQRYYQ